MVVSSDFSPKNVSQKINILQFLFENNLLKTNPNNTNKFFLNVLKLISDIEKLKELSILIALKLTKEKVKFNAITGVPPYADSLALLVAEHYQFLTGKKTTFLKYKKEANNFFPLYQKNNKKKNILIIDIALNNNTKKFKKTIKKHGDKIKKIITIIGNKDSLINCNR